MKRAAFRAPFVSLVVCALLLARPGFGQTSGISTSALDIAYGPVPYQALDVFSSDIAGNAPVILLVHGQASDKGDWGQFRPFFLDLGFVVVLPQWQGSTATTTDPIADVGLAYAWIQQNIRRFGGDPSRVNIGGSSAGAYLAAMEAFARELGFRSFIGLAGLYRADPFINGIKERVLDSVNTNDPPSFLCHGEADTTAPTAESIALANRLTSVGVENHLYLLPGIGHPDIKSAVFQLPDFQNVRADLGVFLQSHNDIALLPAISAVASDATAAEPGTTDTGLITITRAGSTNTAITVNYTLAGTATAGADYTALTGTVTLAAAQISTNLIIRPLNDAFAECEETVTLTIAAGLGYVADPTNATATVRIADNDLPMVRVSATDPLANEAGDTGTFLVTRTGCTNGALTINFTVTGTATAGADYPALSGLVTIPAGTNSQSVVVTPSADALTEADETVGVTLAAGTGYNVNASNSTATVTIRNDGAPPQPALARSPAVLPAQSILAGQTAPGQSFQVWNAGNGVVAYTIVDGAPWITVSPSSGSVPAGTTNTHTVTYTTAGLSPDTYAATMSVTATNGALNSPQTIGVSLTVAQCTYTINPTQRSLGRAAATGTVSVATDVGCGWSATSNDSWLSITTGSTGTGSGVVAFAASANVDCDPRAGTLTVAGQTFVVTQAGGAGAFVLTPTSRSHGGSAETGSISVGSTGTNCTWSATSNDAWLSVTAGTTGAGNGVVTYAVGANPTCTPRAGSLTIGGQVFSVTQDAGAKTFTIDPTIGRHGSGLASGSVTISASSQDCNWSSTSNDGWITIVAGATGVGDGVTAYVVAANDSCAGRNGTLTVAGQTFVVTQEAATGSYAIAPKARLHEAAADTGSFAVTTAPGDCDWVATTTDAWITITSAAGNGAGVVTYFVASNASLSARVGTIALQGQTFTITQNPTAAGAGLLGEYFAGTDMLTQRVVRVDGPVSFDWGSGSPDPSVPADGFSVRWSGQIVPRFSETYTLEVVGNGGVRLWVAGALVIDNWNNVGAGTNTATVTFTGGASTSIALEFVDRSGAADVTLSWSSASQAKEVVPASQLIPALTGLVAEYFGDTNLTAKALTRIEPQVNFSWGGGSPDPSVPTNGFSARWTGQIVPNFSETYTFSTVSDDGVRLWVNGAALVTNWTNHGNTTNSGTIALLAGQRYDIKMEYYDNIGGAVAKLLWSSTSEPRGPVPTTQLWPQVRGLRAEYFAGTNFATRALTRTDPQVDFNWGQGGPDSLVGTNTFSTRWTGQITPRYSETYTFSTVSDDGVRLWVNGAALVTNWTLHGVTTNTGTITLTAGKRYDVKMEYFDNTGGAVAKLFWASASQPREIVPAIQLSWPTNGTAALSLPATATATTPTMKTSATAPAPVAATSLPGVRLVFSAPAPVPQASPATPPSGRRSLTLTGCADPTGRWLFTRDSMTSEFWITPSASAPCVYDIRDDHIAGWLTLAPDNRVDAYLDDSCAGVFDPDTETLHLQGTDASGQPFDLTGTRQ